jgi:CHAT domain
VAGDLDNGARRRRIHLVEIDVLDDTIRWTEHPDWPREYRIPGRDSLGRTEQRCASIDLLVELLRHHSDQKRDGVISDELYGELLKVVGSLLFQLLFVGDLRPAVAQALGRFERNEIDLLRIKLSFEGRHQAWLARLPWEYLHTPPGDRLFDSAGVFLSRRAELMLSRRLDSARPRQLGDTRPLTVLLVSPNPRSAGAETRESELLGRVDASRIVQKFEELASKHRIVLEKLIDDAPDYPVENPRWVTRAALKQVMRRRSPVIVHFLGHGRNYEGMGQLLFSRADGSPDWIEADDFSKAIESPSLKLAFLQACESALPDPYVPFSGVAMRLAASGLPAVVAMQYRIKAELALAFTEAFYDELLLGNSAIDVAVEAGRERIDDQMDERDRLAFGLPVVYLASHDGMLIDDRGRSEPPVDRQDTRDPPPCPRCTAIPHRDDAMFCQECRLQLRCSTCADRRRFPDPVRDRFCDECNTPIHQPPWEPDELTREPAPAPPATAGVLSILGGPRGVES